MMKRVVLINQSASYLMVDIVNAYADEYDEVVLLTGKLKETERRLSDMVKVSKLVAYDRSSALKRILTWVVAFVQIFFKLLFKYRGYEVVYVTNPPLSYLASLVLCNPFSVIVFDTYPDALRNIGIKQGHWLYNLWSKWNRKLFRKARKVYTLSEGMACQLTNYVEREQIKVVPLWPASEAFAPIAKEKNPFALEHHLENKFVVMYSGNMGYTHSVDTLVDVAERLADVDKVHFLFVGDGKKKAELVASVAEKGLANCTFLDWQSVEMLPYSLSTADLGVITLNEETALTSVPSKTFNLLAVGAPLLCIAPKHAEIAGMVERFENGIVCPATDIDSIAAFIKELAGDDIRQQAMSASSLTAAKEYTKENAKLYLPD